MMKMIEQLPKGFEKSMRELLGGEYPRYVDSLSDDSYTAFRVNTGKISLEEWRKRNPFSTSEVAWTEKGFYYDAKKDNPAKHPYYYAGLYYIQEPSAMIPASLLPVEKGDRVLDLCAAPGGKATELGAKLEGSGLLVANDISVSRTMALAKNLQLAGITNVVVTAESPERLSGAFGEYFDKILIDAPCSGEGMFRREPRMIKDWLEKGPEYYAVIQKEILQRAYELLKPGGMLVYSTCTFSVQEDEMVVQWLLEQHSDMEICPVVRKDGFAEGRPELLENGLPQLKHCVRIFPHRAKGEGHFAVLLRKKGDAILSEESCVEKEKEPEGRKEKETFLDRQHRKNRKKKQGQAVSGVKGNHRKNGRRETAASEELAREEMEEFLQQLPFEKEQYRLERNTAVLLPAASEIWSGLRVIYQGMPLCEWKHKLQPSHQLALTLKVQDYRQVLNLPAQDERVIRYLKGETLQVEKEYRGNVLVCVDGFGLGWGQGSKTGTLKNKYYSGWRYI